MNSNFEYDLIDQLRSITEEAPECRRTFDQLVFLEGEEREALQFFSTAHSPYVPVRQRQPLL